jgi:hypothetical protein
LEIGCGFFKRRATFGWGFNLVDKQLKGDWVSICCLQLSVVGESDVFQSVNFTERPKQWVKIFP